MRVDIGKVLNDTSKQVRLMNHECKNTIAAESEKIINLYTPNIEDGAKRGHTKEIDVIEDCKIIC